MLAVGVPGRARHLIGVKGSRSLGLRGFFRVSVSRGLAVRLSCGTLLFVLMSVSSAQKGGLLKRELRQAVACVVVRGEPSSFRHEQSSQFHFGLQVSWP